MIWDDDERDFKTLMIWWKSNKKKSCHFPLIKLIYGETLDTEEYKLWKEQQTPALGHKFWSPKLKWLKGIKQC